MSLFGDSPPSSPGPRPNRSIFNDADPVSRMGAVSLFADLDADNIASDPGASSPSLWAPTTTSTSPAPAAGIPSRTRPLTKSRAEVIRSLLPSATSSVLGPVSAAYDELWLQIRRAEAQRSSGESSEEITMLNEGAVDRVLDDAMIEGANRQIIRDLVVPEGGDPLVSRGEFNALLALVGLAQAGERPSLEAVDRQRNDLPVPRFLDPILKNTEELRAKPPQKPDTSESAQEQTTAEPPSQPDIHSPSHSFSSSPNVSSRRSKMAAATMAAPLHEETHIKYTDAEDPWASPDMHRGHDHIQSHVVETQSSVLGGDDDPNDRSPVPSSPIADSVSSPTSRVASPDPSASALFDNNISSNLVAGDSSDLFPVSDAAASTTAIPSSAPSPFPVASTSPRSPTNAIRPSTLASPTSNWSYYDNGGFGEPVNPFGGPSTAAATRNSVTTNRADQNLPPLPRSSARTAVEETVLVTLMPEKEGIFLFQHHNYEVVSSRRGSKVIRRYSDFVWLLNCLHKRYPFRALPMLPPKRVALNGNHLSNDGAFIEKRRRGLARFLNAIVRHPVLSLDQLVIMFLTVPTELSVWRKQATISVQDEFTGRKLSPGLEDSLPKAALEELFSRTRLGIRRSADLYIGVCNIMDRLVKRTEGVAADHARIALSLISLTETNADVYATDTSDVPQVNDGLQAMSRHLRACQTLLEDESRAWEAGVLEDLKKQRDALVSMRDMFERRDLLDKDNIPVLEKRINMNKSKIDVIRQKNESAAKYEELEKLTEAIHQDKQSIVDQHNRSVFVRECIRDELRYFQVTQYHVTRWNQDWAQERVKYAEMLADNWRSLIDGLEGMPLGE
ncbi:Sorting nexin mvp1 [Ceratocystis fimbriata CBS 114723]|uniref:Sorting nexin MVP1 n=1 Tax=Ceratocystis fimbriata CBS 114723 TaxID=1035309 RepID=A0A2C5WNK6_9PEZI|nr:Sorting nexin mvp1 [Ceratocystis fimbriata CBS 114723]